MDNSLLKISLQSQHEQLQIIEHCLKEYHKWLSTLQNEITNEDAYLVFEGRKNTINDILGYVQQSIDTRANDLLNIDNLDEVRTQDILDLIKIFGLV